MRAPSLPAVSVAVSPPATFAAVALELPPLLVVLTLLLSFALALLILVLVVEVVYLHGHGVRDLLAWLCRGALPAPPCNGEALDSGSHQSVVRLGPAREQQVGPEVGLQPLQQHGAPDVVSQPLARHGLVLRDLPLEQHQLVQHPRGVLAELEPHDRLEHRQRPGLGSRVEPPS